MAGSPHGKGFWNRGLQAGADQRKEFGRFGRLFPDLRPLNDLPEDSLRALADTMRDDKSLPDNKNIPSGYTYLGQFIDHDITLDVTTAGQQENDTDALVDFRTPALDLDNVYGNGPGAQPALYDRIDQRKLAVGRTAPGGIGDPGIQKLLPNDLLRTREGLAVIGDPRNDENLLVAQTHLAFIKFHNKVVDRIDAEGAGGSPDAVFAKARQTVTWHYQWIVLNDFLNRVVDFNDIQEVRTNGRKLFLFEQQGKYGQPFMPIEFSAGAYRLGHSMIREIYSYNRPFFRVDFTLLFQFTGKSGGIVGDLSTVPNLAQTLKLLIPFVVPSLPGDWCIDWNRYYELNAADKPTPVGSKIPSRNPNTAPDEPSKFFRNFARPLDPYLADILHALPGGGGSLPFLNLLRGKNLGLPSGQDVARAMNAKGVEVPVLSVNDIGNSGADGAKARQLGLAEHTPLWYYVLKEAQLKGGSQRLGPVGSRILAEVFIGLLQADKASFLHQPGWTPTLPAANAGDFTMPDLLRFVADLDPVNEPTTF